MEEKTTDNRNTFAIKTFLKDYLDLRKDKDNELETVDSIRKGVEFKGANLWILIFAIFMASLGLNVNSTAVIIGAMLISPLMGPIMGVGLSVGLNDFELMKRSLKSFLITTLFSVTTATIFFLVSPVAEGQSELLARTSPTIYDVFIALMGGLAGVTALSTKEKGNVIPGVAIATALMPPLCTAGFGLATGQYRFFFGAFYLFFINTVFIALATYIFTRFLKYRKKTFLNKSRERFVKRTMLAITLVTFIPSVFIGLHMVRVSIFEVQADKYIAQVFNFPQTRVIESSKIYRRGGESPRIELLLVGEPLGEDVIENARGQLASYGLPRTELVVRQASNSDKVDLQSLQSSYVELLDEKNRQIAEMKQRLARYQVTNVDIGDISQEVGVMSDNVESMSLTKGVMFDVAGKPLDTLLVCVITPKDFQRQIDREQLRKWLSVRTKVDNVKLFVEPKSNE